MSRCLHLRMKATEGALLRVIGTAERRGFRVAGISTSGDEHDPVLRVKLSLAEGPRALELLRSQLAKLYDVVGFDTPAANEPIAATASPVLARSAAARRGTEQYAGASA